MVLSTALAVVPAAAQDDDGDDGRGPLPGKDACAGLPMAPLAFPRDDRPHNDAHFEWWWWNGHLLTSKGDRYGFIVYFGSRPLLGYQWLDITLTDVRGRRFHVDRQPMILGAPPLREDALVLSADHASARAADGDHTLRFDLDGHQLKLDLKALKPATPYLGDGHMSYYCNQASFYARPRLSIRGTLSQHGRTAAVRGLGYFEHSWGHMPAIELANWNHVNLRLDDGRDLFVGTVRDRPGVEQFTYEFGALTGVNGEVTTLHRGDFKLTPTRYWQRDATCSYPVEYDLEVLGERFHIRPTLDAQELRAVGHPTAFAVHNTPTYWDGEVLVSGDQKGRGYLDMTRYCGA